MYLEHFGLKEPPFRITPHTDFFFDGADRGATLEGLIYAILHDEGIVKVSGEVGSGKTMLCRMLIERLPTDVEIVFLANPSYSREDILFAIADELKLPHEAERASELLRELQAHLIRLYGEGRRVVVLIDEAHAMPEDTLEEVRLLSNLESSRHKLLQLVLFGQPELDEALARPNLRQLRDRITHQFRTRPLSEAEVGRYLSFRLRAAGYRGPDPFTQAAIARVARASGGLTRRINVLADKSLLAAFTRNTHAVTPSEVRAAIADADFASLRRKVRPAFAIAAGVAALLAAGIGIGAWWQGQRAEKTPAVLPAPPVSPAPTPIPAPPPQATAPALPAPLLTGAQLRRISGFSTGGQALLAQRIEAAQERLQREPDQMYSVELFRTANTDPARLERFLIRARDLGRLDQVYVIPLATAEGYRIRVVYGVFPDRQSATSAAADLPAKYQQAFQTGLRTFAELRRAL